METNIQELREDLINYVGSSMLPNKYAIIAYIESLSNDELIDFIIQNNLNIYAKELLGNPNSFYLCPNAFIIKGIICFFLDTKPSNFLP